MAAMGKQRAGGLSADVASMSGDIGFQKPMALDTSWLPGIIISGARSSDAAQTRSASTTG